MLRRDDDSVLRVALDLEVSGKRKRGRPKKQVEKTTKIGFEKGGCPEWSRVERRSASNFQRKWGESSHLCLEDKTG